MSKESYIAESEALNKLFNNMTQRKVDAAEKEKLKKEENKGEQVEAKKPLQAAPTTSRPIHSEYLEKKRKKEEEAKRIEEARRAKMRKQIEKEEAEKAEQERKLAEERKKQEAERKKKEEERLANLFGVTAKKEPKPQSNPVVKPATKDEPVKEESLPVKDESKNEATESKTKEALHVFETVLNKTEESEQGPKDAEPEQKKVAPVIAKPSVSEQISEQPKPPVIPVKDKKPVTDKTVSAPEMKSEAKPVQKPVSQPAQRTESPQKGNSAIMARGQSGMQMEKPKTDKLSITGIVPMKSDRGSKYDSAMKASNAFRTNVFLTCVYNDETREGAYGIVVDMGDKRIIHGMCGHTSDEWEYGFAGAIEAMAEAILAGNNNMLVDENAVKIAKETADNYATALIRTISEKIKDDFKTSYFIFMGGGSAMMRESIERAIDTKNLFFLTDVTANAKGYEIMARAKLTMSGEI